MSYEPKLGTFPDADANHIAVAINVAKEKDIRLIMSLTDNCNYYHGVCRYACKIYIG